MSELLLKESPCEHCVNLVSKEESFSFEGGEKAIEIESCPMVHNDDFTKHRHGIEENGRSGFPWCARQST